MGNIFLFNKKQPKNQPMIFKIVFENEIHRLRRKFVTYEQLL